MSNVFMATLGQRPEAITVAFDRLREQYALPLMVILHTDPRVSGIADAHERLRQVLASDYPDVQVQWHELLRKDNGPLLDIYDRSTASAYYRSVLKILRVYKAQDCTIHLLVAGGRKAMSIYATLAASLVFGNRDRVWTVLSPDEMLKDPGGFHIPPGMRDQVQVIDLPVLPARLTPEMLESDLLDDPEAFIARKQDPRSDFLARLSPQERRLAELLEQHPHKTDQELALLLGKSTRTISNQFSMIYGKLTTYLDFGDGVVRKRQALLDILQGRVKQFAWRRSFHVMRYLDGWAQCVQ